MLHLVHSALIPGRKAALPPAAPTGAWMLRREGHPSKANTVRMHSTTWEARVVFEQERWGRYELLFFLLQRVCEQVPSCVRGMGRTRHSPRHTGHPSQHKHSAHRGPALVLSMRLSLALQAVWVALHPWGKARFKLLPPKVQTRVLLGLSPGEVKWGDVSRVWI